MFRFIFHTWWFKRWHQYWHQRMERKVPWLHKPLAALYWLLGGREPVR